MKFLVIGLGSIGTRHAKNLLALGHEVYGLEVDGRDITQILPGLKGPSEDEIKQADAFIIATPTFLHAPQIEWALELGKHVFVEKPIANEVTVSLEDSIEYAEDTGILVVVGNNLRFHPSVQRAKRYLDKRLLGSPIWAHIAVAQHNDRESYRRDGVTLNWGAHEIDLALHLLGPAEVSAASINKDDTVADICLTHESGCRSVVHLDYLTQPELRETQIFGDNGRRIGLSITERWILHGTDGVVQPPEYQAGFLDDDYHNEMAAFVNAVEGKPWPGATAEDGLATLKIIDTARKMAK